MKTLEIRVDTHELIFWAMAHILMTTLTGWKMLSFIQHMNSNEMLFIKLKCNQQCRNCRETTNLDSSSKAYLKYFIYWLIYSICKCTYLFHSMVYPQYLAVELEINFCVSTILQNHRIELELRFNLIWLVWLSSLFCSCNIFNAMENMWKNEMI